MRATKSAEYQTYILIIVNNCARSPGSMSRFSYGRLSRRNLPRKVRASSEEFPVLARIPGFGKLNVFHIDPWGSGKKLGAAAW